MKTKVVETETVTDLPYPWKSLREMEEGEHVGEHS